ncbi:unnamed protein product [Durusdinium trenchii]|uniref:Uncharacterized protein n=1 Tax=Durusdinium trenchii TaxID=1381693 RepID=A0ABP0PQN4_9DINO
MGMLSALVHLVILPALCAQPVHQWTVQRGGSRDDRGHALQVDASGNAWVAGDTFSSLDGHTNAGISSADVFLMKFDHAGVHQWTVQHGGFGEDMARALEVDASGNSWVAGYTTSSLDGHTNAGESDVFLMKFDTTGVHQWTVQRGGSDRDEARALQVDASGNSWVAGWTKSSLDGYTNAGISSADVFLMLFDHAGVHRWTVQRGGSDDDFGHALQVDASGNAWVAGDTRSSLDGNTNAGGSDVFLMKFQAASTVTSKTSTSRSTTSTSTVSRSTSVTTISTRTATESSAVLFEPLPDVDWQASTLDTVGLEQLVQKPQISSTLTPSVEDGKDFSTGLTAAEDIPAGLLAIVAVLAALTCLFASLGIFCCYWKLQGAAQAELPICHISNPTALPSLTPSMALKPLLFSWSSRMTAEWPRGKVQKLVVSEAGFEACGRHYEFCKLENGWHFVWEDGTVQKVESIRGNILQWRTQHPHPAWQDFRWICTPRCCIENHHDMKPSDFGPYRCGLCARSCTAENHWNCQQHQVHLCPVCAELPPEVPTLGVAAAYLVNIFPPLARRATADESPNFYAICPLLAHGENGMGYDKTCPRDGRPRCSIVDALDDAHSGKVTHFVSWCWAYSLNDVVSSIERWLQKSGEDPLSVFLWMCFFCNNQYRIKEEAIQTPSEDLRGIFESHLVEAGRMLVLLDTVLEPTYVTRAWCIFESYVSIAQDIPMEIILPRTAENFFQETMRCGGIDLLTQGVHELDVRRAKAGSLADEDLIKRIILNTTGFDVVNHAVRSRLVDQLTVLFRELLMPRPP